MRFIVSMITFVKKVIEAMRDVDIDVITRLGGIV